MQLWSQEGWGEGNRKKEGQKERSPYTKSISVQWHDPGVYRVTQQRAISGRQTFLWNFVQAHASIWLQENVGRPSRSGCHFDSRKIGATQRGFWTSLYALWSSMAFVHSSMRVMFFLCLQRQGTLIIPCLHGIDCSSVGWISLLEMSNGPQCLYHFIWDSCQEWRIVDPIWVSRIKLGYS